MTDISSFRSAMSLLAGAVNVITTDGPSGMAGFTATAVCSVTDQPPTLLVCMNRSSYAHKFFTGNQVLCVNVMGNASQEAPLIFADRNIRMADRFSRVKWSPLTTGSPVIEDALVSFDCRIAHTNDVGSHSIFMCEVEDIRCGDAQQASLVYFNRNYHHVGSLETH
ncbi:flavin reductase [Castellaniella caeni]|uniref:flavin reductase n=1 Tax=Castellaniella caeni TaxID=266123 RepID=UPI00082A9B7B|nr:flavin reductase [Castellaniella caeni]